MTRDDIIRMAREAGMDEFLARFAAIVAVAGPGWQPIETAPRGDGIKVDLWIETPTLSWREPNAYWHKGRWWIDNHGPWGEGEGPINETIWPITHWMPVPAPPRS